MALSNSSLIEAANSDDDTCSDEFAMLLAWTQQTNDTEDVTMDLSCTLSLTSINDCSFLNASDGLLGLDLVTQCDDEDVEL